MIYIMNANNIIIMIVSTLSKIRLLLILVQ